MVITCLIRGEALRGDKHARANYEGVLVHSFKSELPEMDGFESSQVDTIHDVVR